LRVLLEWVRTLDLHRTERDVMFVFAEHSNYWDGSGSRPGISTIAKKSKVSERHAKRIVANLAERGYLIQTERSRGPLSATYRLNVQLPISAVSTESTGDKSTDSLGVTSGDAKGDISQRLGVTSGDAKGDISMHAIRKTVNTPLSTTVKAPEQAAEKKSNLNVWEKLAPGLQSKVLKQKLDILWAVRGSMFNYCEEHGLSTAVEDRAKGERALWLEACQRADIWPHVAEQIADHFYIQAGGRIQPEHAPNAFRSPRKAGA
jgi:hypothetical protein